jgi:hypothetical protein
MLNTLLSKLNSMMESIDVALMASSIAQAGEPELARQVMLEARLKKECCGELKEGRPCISKFKDRCALALQQSV